MKDFPPEEEGYSQPPAYSGRKDGYTNVPQRDYRPPSGYSAPSSYPPSSYAPAPPVFQQQTSNNVRYRYIRYTSRCVTLVDIGSTNHFNALLL